MNSEVKASSDWNSLSEREVLNTALAGGNVFPECRIAVRGCDHVQKWLCTEYQESIVHLLILEVYTAYLCGNLPKMFVVYANEKAQIPQPNWHLM